MSEKLGLPPLLSVSRRYRDAADELMQCIQRGTYCALIGSRFSGKSELLHSVRHLLTQDQTWACLLLDMQDVESSTQTGFFATLISITAERMQQLTGCELSPGAEQAASSAAFRAFLSACVTRLERDLVLMIDNLEAIPNDLVQALLTSLRAAYMEQQSSDHRVVAVVSGALSLATRTVGESSPLRGIIEQVLVGEHTESESVTLADRHLSGVEVAVSPAAQACIARYARGDPALINWVCERCVQIAHGSRLTRLTANTVKRVIREFLREEAPRYAPLQEAIRLIEEDPDLLSCILQLLARPAVPLRELPLPLSPDLDPLYLTGMVRRVDGDLYQLRNEIYREYLAQHLRLILASAGRRHRNPLAQRVFCCLAELELQSSGYHFPVQLTITGSELRSLDPTVIETDIMVHGIADSPVCSNGFNADSLVSFISLGFGRRNMPGRR